VIGFKKIRMKWDVNISYALNDRDRVYIFRYKNNSTRIVKALIIHYILNVYVPTITRHQMTH